MSTPFRRSFGTLNLLKTQSVANRRAGIKKMILPCGAVGLTEASTSFNLLKEFAGSHHVVQWNDAKDARNDNAFLILKSQWDLDGQGYEFAFKARAEVFPYGITAWADITDKASKERFRLICVHLPVSVDPVKGNKDPNAQFRIDQYKAGVASLQKIAAAGKAAGRQVVLMGDLNEDLDNKDPREFWDPAISMPNFKFNTPRTMGTLVGSTLQYDAVGMMVQGGGFAVEKAFLVSMPGYDHRGVVVLYTKGASTVPTTLPPPPKVPVPPTINDAAVLILNAKKEVGYREGGGKSHNNDQKYSDQLPGFKWSDFQPWCATFVSWNFWKTGLSSLNPTPSASCDVLASGFKKIGRWSEYPALGAVVFFGSARDYVHTGIVYALDKDYIYTIEGNTNNTGSREGDGVYLKKRSRRDSYTQGYGYPKFREGIRSVDPAWKNKK